MILKIVWKSKFFVEVTPSLCLLISLILSCTKNCNSYQFHNMGYTLQRFIDRHVKEEKFVEMLDNRIKLLHQNRNKIKKLAKLFSKPSSTNPSKPYLLPWWYTGGMNGIKRMMIHPNFLDNEREIIENLLDYNSLFEKKWIGSFDIFLSSQSWIHFHEVYLQKPGDMAYDGVDIDVVFGGELNSLQTMEIGTFAFNQKYISFALDWTQATMQKQVNRIESKISGISMDLLGSLYSFIIQEHNKVWWEVYMDTMSGFDRSSALINLFTKPVEPSSKRYSERETNFQKWRGRGPESRPNGQFMDLCMGNRFQSAKEQSKLKCFYERKKSPYFQINPVKVEHLSETPPLYQFYEVISKSKIDWLKNESRKDEKGNCKLKMDYGFDSEVPSDFYKMSEMLSGLRFVECPWHGHFVRYTYGRYSWLHDDHIGTKINSKNEFLEEYGDYPATILYYLEIPPLGGETAFASAGVVGRPIRGSAIFWYNVYRNGTQRKDVAHGGCPVIHGEKIILAHFFRYNSNFDRYKCSLNQHE